MSQPDVIVIGGGIAGVATAYQLARHGHRVTLLERGELAGEASGVNAGSIDATGWGRAPDLQVHLTTGSLELFQALQGDEGHDIELRSSGYLQAIHTEAQLAWARERVRDLTAGGHSAELLDASAARKLEPELNPDLPGYVHYPERAQADPVKATRAFAEAAIRRSARVLTEREVRGLRRDGRSWRVEAGAETLAADALVLAAGPWCAALGAMTSPSCRCAGRCGRRRRSRPAWAMSSARRSPSCTGRARRAGTRPRRLSSPIGGARG